uniref:Uncharacterized protein n=1 Tax=Pseudomonas phage RVTF4 TaxID=3236931 RepID=A0AB39CC98_9VIRU
MIAILKTLLEKWGFIKVQRHFILRDKINPEFEVRRAYMWDGRDESRAELKKFLGAVPVKFYSGDGSVTVAGYQQIYLQPNMLIWEDSDGYDVGSMYHVERNFIVEACTS